MPYPNGDIVGHSFPLYARQFICSPTSATSAPVIPRGFREQPFGGTHIIYTHPLLPVAYTNNGETEVALLGFMMDPTAPESDDATLLHTFLEARSVTDIARLTHGLTGRFLLFFKNSSMSVVLGDACGLRQLHYCKDNIGNWWCFSQPSLVRETLGLEPGPTALEFWRHASALSSGCWWPGDAGPYPGVRRLTPNHCLHLTSGHTQRFWPSGALEKQGPDRGTKTACDLLRGGIEAALHRAPLALPITAGIDSRVLLAAARPFVKDLVFYTMRYAHMPEDHEDLLVARRLAEIAGLSWSVLPCPNEMTAYFEQQYYENCTGAHPAWGIIAQGLHKSFPEGRWCVKGNVSEVARCKYYLFGRPIPAHRINGTLLCNLYNLEGSRFAASKFQEWLAEALPLCKHSGIVPTDLFYWEQFMGSWQAMSQLEWDVVMETITPYNNRLLLETMLSVPYRYRRGPDYQFHHDLIRRMWPELLSLPFNPGQSQRSVRVKNGLHDLVRLAMTIHPGLYYPLKKFYRRFAKARLRY